MAIHDLLDMYVLSPRALGFGHTYQANLSFPCYNYHLNHLNGSPVSYKTTLHEITEVFETQKSLTKFEFVLDPLCCNCSHSLDGSMLCMSLHIG